MKFYTNCPKCGHTITIHKITELERPKCPHCQIALSMDQASKKKNNFYQYGFLFIMILIVSMITTFFQFNFIIILLFAVAIGGSAGFVSLWIMGVTRKITYEKLVVERVVEKDKPKKKKKK